MRLLHPIPRADHLYVPHPWNINTSTNIIKNVPHERETYFFVPHQFHNVKHLQLRASEPDPDLRKDSAASESLKTLKAPQAAPSGVAAGGQEQSETASRTEVGHPAARPLGPRHKSMLRQKLQGVADLIRGWRAVASFGYR